MAAFLQTKLYSNTIKILKKNICFTDAYLTITIILQKYKFDQVRENVWLLFYALGYAAHFKLCYT